MTDLAPAAGRRVRQAVAEYRDTRVYHSLYLPTDWRAESSKCYPVFVEYAGNGGYRNAWGDVSTGRVEDSRLGYGLTEGKGWIWLCLPYVSAARDNALNWWGDVPATLDYARRAVRQVCEEFGGDHASVVMAGFSRGAIACGYLGLHDIAASDIWLAFFSHSHFDGVREWPYPGSDRSSALTRLARLNGRAWFVSHEGSVTETRQYIESSGMSGQFTWQPLNFRNHSDEWVLREIPERRAARVWLARQVSARLGVSEISGRVQDQSGRSLSGLVVESGFTHFCPIDDRGRFQLGGLLPGTRTVQLCTPDHQKVLAERRIELTVEPVHLGTWTVEITTAGR